MLDLSHVTKLDLGSGSRPRPGFVGIDIGVEDAEPPAEVWNFDLASGAPWPFADGQVTELHSSHLIEHLPAGEIDARYFADDFGRPSKVPTLRTLVRRRQDALFWFMDEAWRICAPGATFELRWPALVDTRQTPHIWRVTAWMDPTHRRFIPFETLGYFNSRERKLLGVAGYAVSCEWHRLQCLQGELAPQHVENIAILQKPGIGAGCSVLGSGSESEGLAEPACGLDNG